MAVAAERRLPGVSFEVQAPQPVEILPRMDVAVFVGFASSGPLHTPVSVEDAAEFAKVFGADAPLAWDGEQGEQTYAYLGPAVRAFFQNGGRRCWIVRVADDKSASSNLFPVPCLAKVKISEDGSLGAITPAFARARSEGSWSDSLLLGSALSAKPIVFIDASFVTNGGTSKKVLEMFLRPLSARDIGVGDLLRLTYRDSNLVLMMPIQTLEAIVRKEDQSPPGERRDMLRATCGPCLRFRSTSSADLLSPPASATAYAFRADPLLLPFPVLSWRSADNEDMITLALQCTFESSPEPGNVLRVDGGPSTLWFTVEERRTSAQNGSLTQDVVEVSGRGLWVDDFSSTSLPAPTPICEVLSFELSTRQTEGPTVVLSDLGFEQRHQFFWGSLPTDVQLYRERCSKPTLVLPQCWELAGEPRFPIAGMEEGTEIEFEADAGWEFRGKDRSPVTSSMYFPVAMPSSHQFSLGPLLNAASPIVRDGLETFTETLFLDEDMKLIGSRDLIAQADFLRYQSPEPRPLRGIYAALEIEEATMLALPDAVQRGWKFAGSPESQELAAFSPPERAQWWHFKACDPKTAIPQTSSPEWGNFLDCAIRVLSAPAFPTKNSAVLSGRYTIRWELDTNTGVRYVLEESTDPTFSSPSTVYSGTEGSFTVYGKGAGQYWYRVRSELGEDLSDWSNGISVVVAPRSAWQLNPISEFQDDTLLSVHRAALRMCGARGDMMAVLAFPSHYGEENCIAYASTLRSTDSSKMEAEVVGPLSVDEQAAFSYGTLYHPWLMSRDESRLKSIQIYPPDGAACGIIAKRSATRGPWIAPANELMKGILSLSPPVGHQWHRRFQDEQINLIRQEPRGFTCLNSDTLSADMDLRQINVRRLLILLRRAALRLGASYVFEPNNSAFRRRVQRGFEAMLDYMYVRGAFKGATHEEAYQVVTDATVNTDEAMELGRFIVELKVAPSLPMRFLTVRLVQTGDRTLVALEG